MDTLGVSDLFAHFADQSRSDPIDLFTEMAHLKKSADSLRRDFLRKESEVQDLEGKYEMERVKNEELAKSLDQHIQENEQMTNDLNGLQVEGQKMSETNAKLEEDKNSLLSYVEECIKEKEDLSTDLKVQ